MRILKTVAAGVFLLGCSSLAGQNTFKIGGLMSEHLYTWTQYTNGARDINADLVSSKYNQFGKNSSALNVMTEDGFNLMQTWWPDPWFRKSSYFTLADLALNNNVQIQDYLQYWFRPTVPSAGNPYLYNDGIIQFNAGSSNPNFIGFNYDWLFQNVYNDQTIVNGKPRSDAFYMHHLNIEFDCFHYWPVPGYGDSWMDDNPYPCAFTNPPSCSGITAPNNPSEASGNFRSAQPPPQKLADAFAYLRTTYPVIASKPAINQTHYIGSGIASHSEYISDNYTNRFNAFPFNGIYRCQDYVNFPSVPLTTNPSNRPEVFVDEGYYGVSFVDWYNTDGYLGKFKNIDYIHSKGYSHILSANFICREASADDIYSIHTNPNVPNANMLRFLLFTSIIHGVDALTFYTIDGSSGIYKVNGDPNEYIDPNFDPTGNAITQRNARFAPVDINNQDPYKRENMPYVYRTFVAKATREIAYLSKNGSIKPNNTGNLLYKKAGANTPDPYGIVEPCVNYLNNIVGGGDYVSLNAYYQSHYGSPSAMPGYGLVNPHKNDESYGVRYIITTNNNGEAVMIISNPNPFSIHDVDFDFTNIGNSAISTAKGVDVLFEENPTVNVNATNYKTDTAMTVGTAPTLDLRKKYTLPFCANNKKLKLEFGPLDVKVLVFKTTLESTPASNNGWTQVWTNGGNNTLGPWGGWNNSMANNKFIPVDFNCDGVEELLCIQGINSDGSGPNPDAWASVVSFNGTGWNNTAMWTNSGNGTFDKNTVQGWVISADDKYIVGDFDGNGYKNEILCFRNNSAYATIMRANPSTMNFDWWWSNNGNGTLNSTNGSWTIQSGDKIIVGDFNLDGKDNDILCVHDYTGSEWSVFNLVNSTVTFNKIAGNTSGWMSTWQIKAGDIYKAGDFDGSGNRNEILCFDANNTYAADLKMASGAWSTQWGNTNNNIGGYGRSANENILVGDIDGGITKFGAPYDINDELMFIQGCSGCGWSVTEQLNSTGNGMDWHWSNHNSNYATVMQNYIADWKVNDVFASNVRYLLIKPVAGDKRKYLLAFKDYGCGNNLISMYKVTLTGSNYRETGMSDNTGSALNIVKETLDFSVIPNPNNGEFAISYKSDSEKTVTVYDAMGKLVLDQKTGESILNIKLPFSAKGIYFVKVSDGKNYGVKKIIVNE